MQLKRGTIKKHVERIPTTIRLDPEVHAMIRLVVEHQYLGENEESLSEIANTALIEYFEKYYKTVLSKETALKRIYGKRNKV